MQGKQFNQHNASKESCLIDIKDLKGSIQASAVHDTYSDLPHFSNQNSEMVAMNRRTMNDDSFEEPKDYSNKLLINETA